MSDKKFLRHVDSAFGSPAPQSSIEALDRDMYGDLPANRNIVARQLPIDLIYPDPIQPRRAIPQVARGEWDGSPNGVIAALERWCEQAGIILGRRVDLGAWLNGGEIGELPETPLIADFAALVGLATSIHRDGLINPITVSPRGDTFAIETGERRWLAHHLLNEYVGTQYRTIAAREVVFDVWRQAAENNARSDLNPVGLARQFSLLLMDSRRNLNDYDPYHKLVLPGECDRVFYAQPARHKIPDGESVRFQAAMGMSEDSIGRIRKLLHPTDERDIDDALWMRADSEDWKESHIRNIATLPTDTIRSVIQRDAWSLDDFKPLLQSQAEGKLAGKVTARKPSPPIGGDRGGDDKSSKTKPNPAPESSPSPTIEVGQQFMLHDGRGGYDPVSVAAINGNRVLLNTPHGQRFVNLDDVLKFSTHTPQVTGNEDKPDVAGNSADVDPTSTGDTPQSVIKPGDEPLLRLLKQIAEFCRDGEVIRTLDDIRLLDHGTAQELEGRIIEGDNGESVSELHYVIEGWYEEIDQLLEGALLGQFANLLNRIQGEARIYGQNND